MRKKMNHHERLQKYYEISGRTPEEFNFPTTDVERMSKIMSEDLDKLSKIGEERERSEGSRNDVVGTVCARGK